VGWVHCALARIGHGDFAEPTEVSVLPCPTVMCCAASFFSLCPPPPAPPGRYQTILVFNERLKDSMSLEAVLAMMSLSSEFENMMVR
jgi:hypothetical protein